MDRRSFLAGLFAVPFVASLPVALLSSTSPFALSSVLTVGETFTIAGYHAFDPVTRQALPWLQTFRVTAIAHGSAALEMTPFPIWEPRHG